MENTTLKIAVWSYKYFEITNTLSWFILEYYKEIDGIKEYSTESAWIMSFWDLISEVIDIKERYEDDNIKLSLNDRSIKFQDKKELYFITAKNDLMFGIKKSFTWFSVILYKDSVSTQILEMSECSNFADVITKIDKISDIYGINLYE